MARPVCKRQRLFLLVEGIDVNFCDWSTWLCKTITYPSCKERDLLHTHTQIGGEHSTNQESAPLYVLSFLCRGVWSPFAPIGGLCECLNWECMCPENDLTARFQAQLNTSVRCSQKCTQYTKKQPQRECKYKKRHKKIKIAVCGSCGI